MTPVEPTVTFTEGRLVYTGDLVLASVSQLYEDSQAILRGLKDGQLDIDLSRVNRIDTAGAAMLDEIAALAESFDMKPNLLQAEPEVTQTLNNFSLKSAEVQTVKKEETGSFIERIGLWLDKRDHEILEFVYLLADTFYYGFVRFMDTKGRRKGEFANQSILIGMKALPVVGLISFLIGFILALQSAAQLRQFGASIYVADLIAVAMTREMGPLITAIVIAGRSGSAITSEIATMVVTEETDALKSMGLNPVKYVLVPKVYAITMTMPMLTILSMIIGIFGALVIGYTYLDIAIKPFMSEVINILVIRDIITGLVKSLVFAWLIVVIAAFYGFRTKGGPAEVGRATTLSVVASIFAVIFADSILGLIFYFGQDFVVY